MIDNILAKNLKQKEQEKNEKEKEKEIIVYCLLQRNFMLNTIFTMSVEWEWSSYKYVS